MEFEFAKNVKKQSKFQFTWNPSCVCFDTRFFFKYETFFFFGSKNFESEKKRKQWYDVLPYLKLKITNILCIYSSIVCS
jgi:hypothetical protein